MSSQISSPTLTKLVVALIKAQSQIEGAKKDSTNPHFKSKYADLQSIWEACKDALINNDFCISQLVEEQNGKSCLVTLLIHSSGEWLKSSMPIIQTKPDIQGYGSSLTYCRRYSLASILCVCAVEDDDGEKAARAEEKARRSEEQRIQEQVKKENPLSLKDLCLALKEIGCEFNIQDLKDFLKLCSAKKGVEEAEVIKSAMRDEKMTERFRDSFIESLKKTPAAEELKAA